MQIDFGKEMQKWITNQRPANDKQPQDFAGEVIYKNTKILLYCEAGI